MAANDRDPIFDALDRIVHNARFLLDLESALPESSRQFKLEKIRGMEIQPYEFLANDLLASRVRIMPMPTAIPDAPLNLDIRLVTGRDNAYWEIGDKRSTYAKKSLGNRASLQAQIHTDWNKKDARSLDGDWILTEAFKALKDDRKQSLVAIAQAMDGIRQGLDNEAFRGMIKQFSGLAFGIERTLDTAEFRPLKEEPDQVADEQMANNAKSAYEFLMKRMGVSSRPGT